jgi:hypothetical protein
MKKISMLSILLIVSALAHASEDSKAPYRELPERNSLVTGMPTAGQECPSAVIEMPTTDTDNYLVDIYSQDEKKREEIRAQLKRAADSKDIIAYMQIQNQLTHRRFKLVENDLKAIQARNKEAGRVSNANFWKFTAMWAAGLVAAQVTAHLYKWVY